VPYPKRNLETEVYQQQRIGDRDGDGRGRRGGTIDVDGEASIEQVYGTDNFTIDVAYGKTLMTTATIVDNTLTLTGTGTVSRIVAEPSTITDNGGTTVSELAIQLVWFDSGGTFAWGGSGSGTITTLAIDCSHCFDEGVINKVGTGTLTIASGFPTRDQTTASNYTGVKLDIDAGTVVLGSAGTNDDITFNDDADEITVASGATLTTYGTFSVRAAGTNVNLERPPDRRSI